MTEETNTGESIQKQARPGKAKHHLMTGVVSLVAVLLLLVAAWFLGGDRLMGWCVGGSGACDVDTQEPEAPFENKVEGSAAAALPPSADLLPAIPSTPTGEGAPGGAKSSE